MLKLISKKNSNIVNDRQVKLGDKEFNLLDEFYYVVESSEDNHVSNENREAFRREKLQIEFDADLAESKLRFGFNVIKKQYFSQYEVVR